MLSVDLALFTAMNATAATPAGIVTAARWLSQGFPILAGLLTAAGLGFGSPRLRQALMLGLAALVIAWCAARGIRAWVPMPRPAQLGLGVQWIEHGVRAGFPSMHATGAFALAQGLALGLHRRHAPWKWLAFGLAAAVAWSRVCLGVHFPADVLAGALTGCASALAAKALLRHALSWRGRSSAYWFRPARPSARRT